MNKIGIIGAMDEEVDILVELMEIKETLEKASLKFYVGKLEEKDIVLVRCGIGKVNAMDEEVDILVELMEIKETLEKASLKFYVGKLEEKDIVLVRCGIGKVNSALCAQILISEFNVDAVVNTGVAGALHADLDVQDIVISTDAIQYDVDTTAFGYKKGIIPRMETSIFVADERLINAAYESSVEENKGHKVLKGLYMRI